MRIKGKKMTLQNTDISARLWNPCAKGSEQPFRQGAICQQGPENFPHQISDETEEMCRALEEKDDLQPSCRRTSLRLGTSFQSFGTVG